MKSQLVATLIVFNAVAAAAANAGQAAPQRQAPAPARTSAIDAGLPPLIDRELFFGNPEIATGDDLAGRPATSRSASRGTGR